MCCCALLLNSNRFFMLCRCFGSSLNMRRAKLITSFCTLKNEIIDELNVANVLPWPKKWPLRLCIKSEHCSYHAISMISA